MAGPGLREFLYGLGTAGNTFVNFMLRAQESALAHERQKELLGLKKGGPKGPGLAGMSEREIASNERAAIAENEMHQEVLKASGRRPGMPNQGSLSADEAAVLQRKRITPKGVDPAVAIPSAETGRSFASFDPEAERARIREKFAQGDVVPLGGPAFGSAVMGPFTKFMDAFRAEPGQREQMYPSAQLEADMARNPFTKDLRAALGEKDKGAADLIVAGVKEAPADSQGDIMQRLAGLDDASRAAAGTSVARALAFFSKKARADRISEASTIAEKRAAATGAQTRKNIAVRVENDRRKGIDEAISRALQNFKAQNIAPTDEEIIAEVPGATQADLDAFRKAPRAARMPGRGEPPEQAAAKREQAAAQSALGAIRKSVIARNGGVLPGEIDSARQAFVTLYGAEPTDDDLATTLATTVEMVAAGDRVRKGAPRPKVGLRRRATGAAPVTPTKTSTPTQGARPDRETIRETWRKYGNLEPVEQIRRAAADLGMTPAEVKAEIQKR